MLRSKFRYSWSRPSTGISASVAAKGVAMGELVNELLKRDIELIETAK